MLPYADLHVHSIYSDGTMTPQELLKEAVDNGVGLLAIADHNVLRGCRELLSIAPGSGVGVLPAVELDVCGEEEGHVHILAYGIDAYDEVFAAFVQNCRATLDRMSDDLLIAMEQDGRPVSYAEYQAFAHDPALGGWKALQYFLSIGLTKTLMEGAPLYARYGCTYESAGFPTLRDACGVIRAAGGRAVLAHPGETLDTSDLLAFAAKMELLMDMGLDGVECYYPTHAQQVLDACLSLCRRRGLIVTGGSDCHGIFGKTRVGGQKTPSESLRLRDLAGRICR